MGLRMLCLDVSAEPGVKETDINGQNISKELPTWKRCGKDIQYIQNKYTNDQCPNGLYSVSFNFDFEKGEKEIYFAHSMPYTYTMLNEYLNKNVTKEKAKR